jgi:hypothetical protein
MRYFKGKQFKKDTILVAIGYYGVCVAMELKLTLSISKHSF